MGSVELVALSKGPLGCGPCQASTYGLGSQEFRHLANRTGWNWLFGCLVFDTPIRSYESVAHPIMNTPNHQPFWQIWGLPKTSLWVFFPGKKDAKALAEEWLTGLAPDVRDLGSLKGVGPGGVVSKSADMHMINMMCVSQVFYSFVSPPNIRL